MLANTMLIKSVVVVSRAMVTMAVASRLGGSWCQTAVVIIMVYTAVVVMVAVDTIEVDSAVVDTVLVSYGDIRYGWL